MREAGPFLVDPTNCSPAVAVRLVLPVAVLQRLIVRVALKVEIASGIPGEASEDCR